MLYAYARVSTAEQDLAAQLHAFNSLGVDRVFEEKRSGVRARPRLQNLLYCLRRGDVLVVWKLDRIARSLRDLLNILDRVERAGASFRSLTESFDTATPLGRLTVHLLGAFSEFERSVIRERCEAGTRAAIARGVKWGRPRHLDWRQIRAMSDAGLNPCEIARRVNAHHTAVRYILKSQMQ